MAKSDILVRWKADTQNYDANVSKMKRTLDGFVQSNLTASGVMRQLTTTMLTTASSIAGVTAVLGTLTSALKSNIETARGFEKSMSQLSSLTGMVGGDLEKLKEYAIELGSTTTLSASQVADAFKMIGSQQPQLLQSGEALKKVTEYAIRLSEAAGIDLSTAAQTLSTSINQMGGDSNNAERYINVLAAASQKGAGDIAWLGEAITKSAAIAKAAGTDYEELVANLEQLAKAGFDASTSGTALRSIIMNLEKQSNQNFKPSVVGLTQAFENLGKANLDIAGYQGIVGKMFAAQAMALANAAKEARKMTEDITGTSTATEQAKTNVDNLDGSMKSLSSAWEGFNLHINSSNGFLRDVVDGLTSTVRLTDQLYQSISNLTGPLGTLFTMIGDLVKSPLESLNKKLAIANGLFNTLKGYLGGGKSGSSQSSDVGLYKNNPVLDSIMGRSSHYGSPIPETAKPTPTSSTSDNGTASLSELKAQLKELRKLRDEAIEEGDMALRDDYNAQIKAVQAQIKALKGDSSTTKKTTKEPSPEGSIAAQEQLVQDLTKEWKNASDETMRTDALERLEKAKKTLEEMTTGNAIDIEKLYPQLDVSDQQGGTPTTPFEKAQNDMRIQIAEQNVEVDQNTFTNLLQVAVQNGLESLSPDFTSFQEKLAEGLDIPDDKWEEFTEKINEQLAELGIDPINIDLKTGDVKTLTNDTKEMSAAWKSAASAVSSAGAAMKQIDDPAAKIAGIVAEAIASIALGYANASSQASEMGPWVWLAFAAAGLATTLTTIAQIKQATAGSYAEGGIIPGNNFSGDLLTANVNSGELILNRAQQGAIADQLTAGDGVGNVSDDAVVRVAGEDLLIVLNTALRRRGLDRLTIGDFG